MDQRSSTSRLARLRPHREQLRYVGVFIGYALLAALVYFPVALERGIEDAHFSDVLGTFPVEVGLAHDGGSTLDTGIFGKVYLHRTGIDGFGAYARATGPPDAGGSLASYVDPKFIRANVELIDDPEVVVREYSAELTTAIRRSVVHQEILAAILGGALLLALVPRLRGAPRGRTVGVAAVLTVLGLVTSTGVAVLSFNQWPRAEPAPTGFTVAGLKNLSFSSSETREIAAQVKPFIEKNRERFDKRSKEYEADTAVSFKLALANADLAPRAGEQIVLAEADPQGSYVGTVVRKAMYRDLVARLGKQAIGLRTISGDVSSNGTVAEAAYIATEAKVSGTIPTVAAGGDHDSVRTWDQMRDAGIEVPDLEVADVDGLRVAAANDREHKTLFGGMITNTSGISESELGAKLRKTVVAAADPDHAGTIALLHQPDAAAGYLRLEDLDPVRSLTGSKTTPYDDGIPDQPPGVLSIGHLHRADGPWVLWNTDGDVVSWTVVDQLGTAGGVENAPTFSRFSTPFSVPLKPIMVRLQYLDTRSGLETGYVTINCDLDGRCTISDRTEVGLPGGQPLPARDLGRVPSDAP